MSDRAITRVSAWFSLGNQDTGLAMYTAGDGTFDVSALYRSLHDSGFPAQEILRREGRVYQADVDGLVRTLCAVCASDWFHHYRGSSLFPRLNAGGRWGVEIQYDHGPQSRWEGSCDAPTTLGGLYDLLVSFGMPPLKLGYTEVGEFFRCYPSRDLFEHISCYQGLFFESAPTDQDDQLEEEFQLLAGEFIDDVRRYCAVMNNGAPSSASLMAWGIVPDLAELEAVEVSRAPRAQMLALFDALTQAGEPVDVVSHMYASGMLARWCDRMRELPREEARERDQRRKEEREKRMASVDDAIRDRIAQKEVFTAYDVARDIEVTTQQASVRIRSFVRSGQLQTVGDGYPRKYQAA